MASDEDSDDMNEWAKLETVTTFECKYVLEHSSGIIYILYCIVCEFVFGRICVFSTLLI